jgi:Major Facilitator Superfamily.
VFAELQLRKQLAEEVPLGVVVREHRPAIVLSMLLTWVLSAGIVVVILMTPSVLQTVYGFDAATSLKANSVAIVCLSVGCILAGRLADRFGAGRTFIVGSILLGLVSWTFYTSLKAHPDVACSRCTRLPVCASVSSARCPT